MKEMKYGYKPYKLSYRYSDNVKEKLDYYMEEFGFSKTDLIDYLFEFFDTYNNKGD